MDRGSIVAQLAGLTLIDGCETVVNPAAIGSGRTLFEGLRQRSKALGSLSALSSRTRGVFRNGHVLVGCLPAG